MVDAENEAAPSADQDNVIHVSNELIAAATAPCQPDKSKPVYRFVKRAFDIVGSAAALVVLSPLIAGTAIAIKVTDPGPAIFSQDRIAMGKRHFQLYKFRTMRMDTPHDLPTHMINANDWYTPIGATLRKYSLDELPQLVNILKGDMSFIGPRPCLYNQYDLIVERDKYGANAIRPGLSGWAQINGRDSLTIEAKARRDGEYVQKRSVGFDLKCLFGTFSKVLLADGIVEEAGNGSAQDAPADARS